MKWRDQWINRRKMIAPVKKKQSKETNNGNNIPSTNNKICLFRNWKRWFKLHVHVIRTNVWILPFGRNTIQCTGRTANTRKFAVHESKLPLIIMRLISLIYFPIAQIRFNLIRWWFSIQQLMRSIEVVCNLSKWMKPRPLQQLQRPCTIQCCCTSCTSLFLNFLNCLCWFVVLQKVLISRVWFLLLSHVNALCISDLDLLLHSK